MSKVLAFLPVNKFINNCKKGTFTDDKTKEGLKLFKLQMQEFIDYDVSCYVTAEMNLEILNEIETELNTRL